ncbi:MAG: phosphoglycerate dehydrogenase [Bacteroidota bacterium]
MTILIADKLAAVAVEALEADGHTVHADPALKGDALDAALREVQPDILVVRSTKVPAAAIAATASLELVVRAGAGYDNIDVAAASARGIFVANCPGKNAVAVAELTIGLILALDRRIPDNVIDARNGTWNKATYSKADGVKGKTLGLIGFGNIAQAVARRAKALQLDVIAWSRSLTPERAAEYGVRYAGSPRAVAQQADIVSLHVAATPDTAALADKAFFQAMKTGALFINTTRGSVVDEEALAWALEEKQVRAGLDVFQGEPAVKTGTFSHPLAAHPSVYLTHHIGASTQQAQNAIALEASRVANTYAATGVVPNGVNQAAQTDANHLLTVRHLDRVGVLARVLDAMRGADWNVQEMENLIFEGGEAACARIRFFGEPNEAVLSEISSVDEVLAVSVLPL